MRIPARRVVALLAELGVTIVLPWLMFHRFASGLGENQALLLATVPPLVWAAAGPVPARRIDALALLALLGIGLSLLGTALGGSRVLLLSRENLASVVIGLLFLRRRRSTLRWSCCSSARRNGAGRRKPRRRFWPGGARPVSGARCG